MKKIIISLITVTLLLTSCASYADGGDRLVNAENYSGLAFADKGEPPNETIEYPVITTVTEQSQTAVPETDTAKVETDETAANETAVSETAETKKSSSSDASKTEQSVQKSPEVSVGTSIQATLNYDEVIGVWISYIELSGVMTGKTASQFRQSYGEMMDNCVQLGINTVYVQLRPFGDAFYSSDFFPWSKYVTGQMGKSPDYEPLTIMTEEAHKRNISFHGWINPMRISSDADIEKIPDNYLIKKWYNDSSKNGKYIVKCGDYWYLNPAYTEVIELIANGVAEISANYNVDGIHIDDYFYPVTDSWFDSAAYKASGYSSLSEFRLYNCNNMVKTLYSATKKGNPNALFGISPQGSVENNYNLLFADVEKWCKSGGFADYIAPQFYYGFENSSQPYEQCIARWQEMLENSEVKLIMGLAVYKIGKEDAWAGSGSNEWVDSTRIIKRQIEAGRKLKSYGGVVFYSYNYLFNPAHVTPEITGEIEAFKPIL